MPAQLQEYRDRHCHQSAGTGLLKQLVLLPAQTAQQPAPQGTLQRAVHMQMSAVPRVSMDQAWSGVKSNQHTQLSSVICVRLCTWRVNSQPQVTGCRQAWLGCRCFVVRKTFTNR